MISKYFILFVQISLLIYINCEQQYTRLCGDPKCSTPISLGKAYIKYQPNVEGGIAFGPKDDIKVLSKIQNSIFWEIEVNNRHGIAPLKSFREEKMLIPKDKLMVVPYTGPIGKKIETNKSQKELKIDENNLLKNNQQIDKQNKELKSSHGTNIDNELHATTTAPLLENNISKQILTDNELNSTIEMSTISPVQEKVEIYEGTKLDSTDIDRSDHANGADNANDKIKDDLAGSDESEEDEENNDDEDDDDGTVEEDESFESSDENKTITISDAVVSDNLKNIESERINQSGNISEEKNNEELKTEKNINVTDAAVSENKNVDERKTIEKAEDLLNSESTKNSTAEIVSTKLENNTKTNEENKEDSKLMGGHHNNEVNSRSENNTEVNEDNEILKKENHNNAVNSKVENKTEIPKKDENLAVENNVNNIDLSKEEKNNTNINAMNENANLKNVDVKEQNSLVDQAAEKNHLNKEENLNLTLNNDEKNSSNFVDSNLQQDSKDLPAEIEAEVTTTPSVYTDTQNMENRLYQPYFLNKQEHAIHSNEPSVLQVNSDNSVQQPETTQSQSEVPYPTTVPNTDYHITTTPNTNHQQSEEIYDITTPNPMQPIESSTALPVHTENLGIAEENYPNINTLNTNPTVPQNVPSSILPHSTSEETMKTLEEPSVIDDTSEETMKTLEEPSVIEDTVQTEGIISQIQKFFNNIFFPNTPPNDDNELDKISESKETYENEHVKVSSKFVENEFCENIGPNSCPNINRPVFGNSKCSELDFFTSMSDKILEMFDVLVFLAIAAASSILFAFGYYCICNCRKENSLISKLNVQERSLLTATKEVEILKHDLIETRNKLTSIEDNSFGSNDMVISLKKEIVESEEVKIKLQEQIESLEKELENAAEVGLELNKIVSDLLNSQNGDESIAKSVEDLQQQLNEQQNTILEINSILGEKSRENSELNMFLTEQTANYQKALLEYKVQLEESEKSKTELQSKFDDTQKEIEENLLKDLNNKSIEIDSLKQDIQKLQSKYDDAVKIIRKNGARVETLEECIKTSKDLKVNLNDFMNVANLKTEILTLKRERDSIKELLEGEMDSRKLLEDHVKIISEEVANLKLEYNHSEKTKLEAQTRLEVLSTYFKEKETQLQKELSVKEAMWMKQQGETTSTVERVRSMQDDIQELKSQNDALRAEIEAQSAAHKAQITSLENRAHETWLTSRQSERKFEEARSEAAALRRKITALVGSANGSNDLNRNQSSVTDGLNSNNIKNIPSPIHMDGPTSPLGGLPPPPPPNSFLPPFMPPPLPLPHFIGMPPPFMPPGEMRPPPLGRLMSPPPMPPQMNHNRYSPSLLDDDDDDYEYHHQNRHRGNRYSPEETDHRYSPENDRRYSPDNDRRYSPVNNRRYSPNSRYNYGNDIVSTYDTETDFSPPPSPRGGGNGNRDGRFDDRTTPLDGRGDRSNRSSNKSGNADGGYKAYSPQPHLSNTETTRNKTKTNKGIFSSGSEKSVDSRKSKGKLKV